MKSITALILLFVAAAALAQEPDRGAQFNEPCSSIFARESSISANAIVVAKNEDPAVGGSKVAPRLHGDLSRGHFLYECDGQQWNLSNTVAFATLSDAAHYFSYSIQYLNAKYGQSLIRDNHLLSFWSSSLLRLRGKSEALNIYLWESPPNDVELALVPAPDHGWEVQVRMGHTPPKDKALLYPAGTTRR